MTRAKVTLMARWSRGAAHTAGADWPLAPPFGEERAQQQLGLITLNVVGDL